ncbi:MAG: hypothetical protein ACFE8O_02560 [Candidatus Hermodarchaeota archaeon]
MHFLSKILRDTVDESVHRAFLRYGKGEYDGPVAEISIAKSGTVKVRSNHLYQDLIASVFVKHVPVDTVSISGIVLGYEPLDETIAALSIEADPFKKKPRTQLFESKIAGVYPVKQVVSLYDDIGENALIFCNLSTDQAWSHKSKTKIPSAQKEIPIEEQLKFSTTKIPAGTNFVSELLLELTPDFLDDIPDAFSTLRIENTYEIQDLIFPPNRDQLTSKEIRVLTQRSGILHRTLSVDDKEFKSKHPMTV